MNEKCSMLVIGGEFWCRLNESFSCFVFIHSWLFLLLFCCYLFVTFLHLVKMGYICSIREKRVLFIIILIYSCLFTSKAFVVIRWLNMAWLLSANVKPIINKNNMNQYCTQHLMSAPSLAVINQTNKVEQPIPAIFTSGNRYVTYKIVDWYFRFK